MNGTYGPFGTTNPTTLPRENTRQEQERAQSLVYQYVPPDERWAVMAMLFQPIRETGRDREGKPQDRPLKPLGGDL